ncbi:Contig_38, whole genome shotgun sequence [Microbacterium sp. 8M]|uniref:DUF6541 family protein n=1 Tax=Microbacterium sp. 8M TaxID=2653153 RepID=UPI0012F3E55F|nr:DUF6541 family protein [Microbacterium sp. 8M]VXB13380.1 Contig_38, whole genome shotgun sequence [Microbacterium sp. 8M]
MTQLLGTWLPFVPPVLAAILVLTVPGLTLGLALRLRGWWLAAATAPLSVSLVVVASVLAGATGVRWGILPVLVLTVVAAVVAWAWMQWVGRPMPRRRARHGGGWASALAFAVAAVPIAYIVCRGFGDPALVNQRYDNFFHVNAIQYVLDTGNASPLWVGTMTSPHLIYPSAWHALGALVAQLSGSAVPLASNALVLVVAAFVWPLSSILLVRTLFGRSRIIAIAAGALSAASPAFPFLPLHYGPLYPLFLGLALAPVAIAAVIRALHPHPVVRRHDLVLLLVLLTPGIAVAHPGAFLAVLALGSPAVLLLAAWLWRRHGARGYRAVVVVGVVLFVGAALLTLKVVRPPADQIYWPVTSNLAGAIGEVVTASVFGYPIAPGLAVLIGLGVFIALVRRTYARSIALGMALIGTVLYVVVAASPSQALRDWLTGPWYNNPPRLASIWAVSVIPLAALGASFLVRVIARLGHRAGLPWRRPRAFALLGFAVIMVLLVQSGGLKQAAADLHFVYGQGPGADGPILSAGEYKLIEEVDEYVPEGAVIAGDPWRGVSFAYAIADRRVLMPHLLMDESAAAEEINRRFATEGDSPEMCAALKKTGVRYILDFDGPAFSKNPGGFEGVEDLEGTPFAKLLASEPGARLYEITTCGLAK